MSRKPSPQVQQAWIDLHRAHRRLLDSVETALKAAGLPPLDWYDVLLELARDPDTGLRPFQIGEMVLLNKHNLSRLVDRLENRGLVRRHACTEDGRGNLIRITAAGIDMLDEMWPVYAGAIEEFFGARLARGDAAALSRILGRVAARANAAG